MPHIIVRLWPGKSEQQKKQLSQLITQDVRDVLNEGDESVSVAFEEVSAQVWKEKVYKPDALSQPENLYTKPGSYPTVEPDVISVTPEEAARITRIPESVIRQAMNERTLPHYEFNRKVKVIPLDRLKAWMEERLVGPGTPVHSAAAAGPVSGSLTRKALGRSKLGPGTRPNRLA